jgi:hypothetical protein
MLGFVACDLGRILRNDRIAEVDLAAAGDRALIARTRDERRAQTFAIDGVGIELRRISTSPMAGAGVGVGVGVGPGVSLSSPPHAASRLADEARTAALPAILKKCRRSSRRFARALNAAMIASLVSSMSDTPWKGEQAAQLAALVLIVPFTPAGKNPPDPTAALLR